MPALGTIYRFDCNGAASLPQPEVPPQPYHNLPSPTPPSPVFLQRNTPGQWTPSPSKHIGREHKCINLLKIQVISADANPQVPRQP